MQSLTTAELPAGGLICSFLGCKYVGGWRKVGMELLGIIAPFPGVLTSKRGFQRCHLCESDPCPFLATEAVGLLAGDRRWHLGASFALLSLPWQAEQLLCGVFSRLGVSGEERAPPQLGPSLPGCAGTPSTEQASKKSKKSCSGWLLICRQLWGDNIPLSLFRVLAGHGMAGCRAGPSWHALAGSCGPVKTLSVC